MSADISPLVLEFLSGPLDGACVTLSAAADLTRKAGGLLGCPWDTELGEPQAAFTPEPGGWQVRSYPNTAHGTYVRRSAGWQQAGDAGPLQPGDVLRAHHTWLRVAAPPSSE
jgi:hypothetical protein